MNNSTEEGFRFSLEESHVSVDTAMGNLHNFVTDIAWDLRQKAL